MNPGLLGLLLLFVSEESESTDLRFREEGTKSASSWFVLFLLKVGLWTLLFWLSIEVELRVLRLSGVGAEDELDMLLRPLADLLVRLVEIGAEIVLDFLARFRGLGSSMLSLSTLSSFGSAFRFCRSFGAGAFSPKALLAFSLMAFCNRISRLLR